jgi:hypothetical protein
LKILINKITHGIMCSPSVAENYEVAAAWQKQKIETLPDGCSCPLMSSVRWSCLSTSPLGTDGVVGLSPCESFTECCSCEFWYLDLEDGPKIFRIGDDSEWWFSFLFFCLSLAFSLHPWIANSVDSWNMESLILDPICQPHTPFGTLKLPSMILWKWHSHIVVGLQ